jgi:hypothetical protein
MPLISKPNRRPAKPAYVAFLVLATILLVTIIIKYIGEKPSQIPEASIGPKDTKNYVSPSGATQTPESTPLPNGRQSSPVSGQIDPFKSSLDQSRNRQPTVKPVPQNPQGPVHDPFKEFIEANKNKKPVLPPSPFGSANPTQ